MREQKEQEKQNELLRVVAEQNHERLIEYDVKEDRAVVYAIENDRFEVLFDIEDYVKKNHYGSVFIDPEDKKVFRRAMHACLQKEGTVTVDVRYCEKENQPEWYRFYLVSIAEEDGKTDRMVGRFCCVQQEKAITERMRRRAEIDVLTNVYNHKAFEEYCAKELAECTTNALFVMLDIDDFKMINDTQGHAVGDMVLSQTGSILSEVTGDRGIVGRLGGDEFAVFASGFQNKCLWRIHNINWIKQISDCHTDRSADSTVYTANKQCTQHTDSIAKMKRSCISTRQGNLNLKKCKNHIG